jgi:hypothetical protein
VSAGPRALLPPSPFEQACAGPRAAARVCVRARRAHPRAAVRGGHTTTPSAASSMTGASPGAWPHPLARIAGGEPRFGPCGRALAVVSIASPCALARRARRSSSPATALVPSFAPCEGRSPTPQGADGPPRPASRRHRAGRGWGGCGTGGARNGLCGGVGHLSAGARPLLPSHWGRAASPPPRPVPGRPVPAAHAERYSIVWPTPCTGPTCW